MSLYFTYYEYEVGGSKKGTESIVSCEGDVTDDEYWEWRENAAIEVGAKHGTFSVKSFSKL